MAIPVNTTTGIEAMGQMAQIGLAESGSALNYAKVKESYANTAIKYAELQQKFQDIAQKDMELDVTRTEQQGKLANAEIFSQRNINMLRNVEKLTKADSINANNAVLAAQLQLDDNVRDRIASLAETVEDPQSHTRAVNEVAQLVEPLGLTIENFGLTREWEGPEETTNSWIFNKNAALASREIMGSERLKTYEHRLEMEKAAKLNEYDFEGETRRMAFTAWQNDLDRQVQLETARSRIASSSKLPIKRSDIDTMTSKEIQDTSSFMVSKILRSENWFTGGDDEDVQRVASQIALNANERVDQSILKFNTTGQGKVVGPAEAVKIELSSLLDRTDNSGKVYGTPPRRMNEITRPKIKLTDIEEAKLNWAQPWKSSLLKEDPRAQNLTEEQLNTLADIAWKTPEKRLK